MRATHLRSKLAVLFSLVVACSAGSSTVGERTGESEAPLSFPSGNDDGYCASNPSPECWHGTPVAPKQIILTFDDGPSSDTPAFSTWLASQGIRATFFVNGMNLGSGASTVLSRLLADGHLVGNHTQNHLNLTSGSLTDSALVRELADTDAIIAPYVANGHFVFRAPFGAWSARDYNVLHASAMDKYVGPVIWDIGGATTSIYAADWDCWQGSNLTSKQCGDRYLRQITDVGRGIVLLHDAGYGNPSNHNLTSGVGNTIDMVKYMVPLLKQQGFTFLRLDEIPDIASMWSSGGIDAGTDASDGGSSTCVWNPTWSQTSYANEWWVEYEISGSVKAASLQVSGGPLVTLSQSYGKWVGGPPSRIATGTEVIVQATNTANQSAQTVPFPYLVTTHPVTACVATPQDSGVTDAGIADSGTPLDAGACFTATWSQGSGANTWWVEYSITASTTIASAWLEVVGRETVPLSLEWNKWVGPASVRIAKNTSVVVHAQNTLGQHARTNAFAYLTVRKPLSQPCSN